MPYAISLLGVDILGVHSEGVRRIFRDKVIIKELLQLIIFSKCLSDSSLDNVVQTVRRVKFVGTYNIRRRL